jgi:hypothetical protein
MSKKLLRSGMMLLTLSILLAAGSGCGPNSPHHGRFPFSLMEKPPTPKHPSPSSLKRVLHHKADQPLTRSDLNLIRHGDVIAFHMSHHDAWKHLRKGNIQKLPYDILSYGHIAIAVPSPDHSELRLLQVAMRQAVNTTENLNYLHGKSWHVYRPPTGSFDPQRLHQFAQEVTTRASDPRKAYDYLGAFGIRNAPCQPDSLHEIGNRYCCATLVIAALHYAGYPLDAVHRKGILDLVTPRQVVESFEAAPTTSAP